MNSAGSVVGLAYSAATGQFGASQYSNVYPNNIMLWHGTYWTSDCLGFVHAMANPDDQFSNNRNVLGGGATLNAFMLNSDEITTLTSYCTTRGAFPKLDLVPAAMLYKSGHVGLYIGSVTYNGNTYNGAECAYNAGWRLFWVDLSTGEKYTHSGGTNLGSTWENWGYFDHIDYSDQAVPELFEIRTQSPAGSYLPYYMTTGAGGYNSSIVGNSANGLGVAGANVLNNCVGYAQGRMMEIHNQIYPTNTITSAAENIYSVFNVDAAQWLTVAQNNGFSTGITPQAGSVAVYTSAQYPAGHVAVFEKVSGLVWTASEGHWSYGGTYGSWDYTSLIYNNLLPWMVGTDYQLAGFIYIGNAPTPTPTPVPTRLSGTRPPRVNIWFVR